MKTPSQAHLPPSLASRLMRRSHLLGDFLVVAAEGGIRQAADKIAISQSALTRRIQDLEAEVGASLFERTSRGMTLTPFGEDPQIQDETLLEVEHLVFADEQHPLNQIDCVEPAQLCAHPWIWFTTGAASRELMGSYFERAGLTAPATSVETSSAESVFRLMQQGDYLMLLPSTSRATAAHHGVRPLRLKTVFGRYAAGMMYRPSVMRLKAFTSFRDALLRKLPALT
jgi:DNA-binding transcriptional LysR family regulator